MGAGQVLQNPQKNTHVTSTPSKFHLLENTLDWLFFSRIRLLLSALPQKYLPVRFATPHDKKWEWAPADNGMQAARDSAASVQLWGSPSRAFVRKGWWNKYTWKLMRGGYFDGPMGAARG